MREFLTDREVAKEFRIAAATLRTWRMGGRGPRWVRIGASVRYLREDLDAYVAERRRRSTSDLPAPPPAAAARSHR